MIRPEAWAAHEDLLVFASWTYAQYLPARHHRLIAERLEAVTRGDCKRLVVVMPPRHGKSELCSIRFPAWYLGRNPDNRLMLTAYADSLALTFSRQVRNLIRDDPFREAFPDVRLAGDSQAVDRWNLAGRRGGVIAAGVGAGITGHGADLLIIDDPVKDAQDADSPVIRERIWEWYTRTAYTRLHPGGAVVVIGTRWHEDDLIGRILKQTGEGWELLHLPAVDADNQALWPDRYDLKTLAGIRGTIGERAWSALYQGQPVPDAGGIFERAWFPVVEAAPAGGRDVRFWDLAATVKKLRNDPDYTVGVKMRWANGRWCILDVIHAQAGPADVDRLIINTATQDGKWCAVRWEQEGGSAGKRDTAHLVRDLAGYDAAGIHPEGDKILRARPLAAQAQAGNVSLLRGAWNDVFLTEMQAQPYAAHDDQMDAAAGAFNFLASAGVRRSRIHK